MGVEGGGVAQRSSVDDPGRRLPSEGNIAASAGCRPGAVDEGWRRLVPPVVDGVGEAAGDVEQGVRVGASAEQDPAGADAVVETEGIEVGLVGEVQGGTHLAQ